MHTFYVCFSEEGRTCGSAHKTIDAAKYCEKKNRNAGDAPRRPYPVQASTLFGARRQAAAAWGFTKEMRQRFTASGKTRGLPYYNQVRDKNPQNHPLTKRDTPKPSPEIPKPTPEIPKPTPEVPMNNPNVPPAEAVALLSQLLSGPSVDFEKIEETARKAAEKAFKKLEAERSEGIKTIRVILGDQPDIPHVEGLVHDQMPTLLQEVGMGNSVWLAGPAGSGKTHAAEQVAEILGREVFIVGQIVDAHADVVGYNDAHGNYMETPLYKWATSDPGAILVLDEIDGSDPNALLKACAIFAKGTYTWPNGVTTKIPREHVLLACANTWGAGASEGYTGREAIDEATRNRFTCRLEWGIDPDLERAIAVGPYKDTPNERVAHSTVTAAQKIRQNMEKNGIRDFSWGPRDTEAAVRRSVNGLDPFKNSVLNTLDERQRKLTTEGVQVGK